MAQAIVMPQLGQTVEECTVVRWLKHEGDTVAIGDILLEIETDKATLEVESFYDGVLLKAYVREGEIVPVLATVGYIGEPGEEAPAKAPPPPPRPKPEAAPQRARPAVAVSVSVPAIRAPRVTPTEPAPGRFAISPRARKLARDSIIDPAPVRGSGPNGRVVEKDVRAYLEAQGYGRLRVMPAAKVLAARKAVDLLSVEGSGKDGRIRVEDVRRAIAEKPRDMTRMRRTLAQRLTQSFTTTPHFFVTVSVDVTDLLAFREELKASGQASTLTDFIMHAAILALEEYRDVNSTTDGERIAWHSRVHMGLAVALDEGLVVPVVRGAEALSFAELHDAAASLVAKARERKLTPDEMQGSTFTISNMGMLDVENFTAIINPGESAILAVSSTVETPVVRGGQIVVRSMMKITLSSDHRIIDGALAARFVNHIKAALEDAEAWKGLI